MTLIAQIAKGAFWTAGAQWIVQVAQFSISIVLARILSPGDYGLVGLALVYIGFVNVFSNLGMGPALIQRREIDDIDICTAFWATAAVSALLFVVSVTASPWVGRFFVSPSLPAVIQVAAVALLLTPLNAVLYSLLTRRMEFRALAMVDVSASLAASTVAVLGATAGLGVWALVLGQIVNPLVRLPLLLRLNHWMPSWTFDRQRFQCLFSFSSNVVGFNIVNYFLRNLDKVIIGKVLGSVSLGFYDISYQVMLKPLQSVSGTISAPLFPALASVQHDKVQASEIYRRVTTYIALITWPIMTGIALVAQDFVVFVLGAKWEPAVPVLQILCFVGAVQSVFGTVGDIYLSQGRSDIMLKWSLAVAPLMVGAFFFGTLWGVVGVAACYGLLHIPLWFLAHHIANPLIGLSARRFWTSLLPVGIMCALMAGLVLAAQWACTGLGVAGPLRLVGAIVVGAFSYGALILWTQNPDVVAVRAASLRWFPILLRRINYRKQ